MTASSLCPASPSVEGVRIIVGQETSKIVDAALQMLDSSEFDLDDNDENVYLNYHLEQQQQEEPSSMPLPPLRIVTTPTSSVAGDDDNDEDDASSVSTISGSADEANNSRRSIFQKYWDQTGRDAPRIASASATSSSNKKKKNQQQHQSIPTAVTVPQQSQKKQTLMQKKESEIPVVLNEAANRRSIFGQTCWGGSGSEPILSLASLAPSICFSARKTESSSSLESTRPKGSCLRRGKFSSGNLLLSKDSSSSSSSEAPSSDATSVTFCEDVSVYVFQKSAERYAQEGWSSWFA